MLALKPLFAVAHDEDKIREICKVPYWHPHEAAWIAAYHQYRIKKGNPWKISPVVCSAKVANARKDFYRKRASSPPFRQIRNMKGLLCCAMCGSPNNGTLDHYLPKELYPEFSIFTYNLLPACLFCNSGKKGANVKGSKTSERFLHPYFDKFADDPLWTVKIVRPLAAIGFHPVPLSTLGRKLRTRITFHLNNVLGEPFYNFAETQWHRLPYVLSASLGHSPKFKEVRAAVKIELLRSRLSAGENGWRTALLRGVLEDKGAITYLTDQIK